MLSCLVEPEFAQSIPIVKKMMKGSDELSSEIPLQFDRYKLKLGDVILLFGYLRQYRLLQDVNSDTVESQEQDEITISLQRELPDRLFKLLSLADFLDINPIYQTLVTVCTRMMGQDEFLDQFRKGAMLSCDVDSESSYILAKQLIDRHSLSVPLGIRNEFYQDLCSTNSIKNGSFLWNHNSDRFVTNFDNRIRVWDVLNDSSFDHRGFLSQLISRYNSIPIKLSPDGQLLIMKYQIETVVIVDMNDGKMLGSLKSDPSLFCSVDWNPNRKQILTGEPHGKMRIWDAETFKEEHTYDCGVDRPILAKWSPGGNYISIITRGKKVEEKIGILDLKTGQFKFHVKPSHFIWSPNGRYFLAITKLVGLARLAGLAGLGIDYYHITGVDTEEDELGYPFHELGIGPYPKWSPNGEYLGLGTFQGVRIFRFTIPLPCQSVCELTGKSRICYFSWSPDSNYILTYSSDGKVRIWDFPTGNLVHQISLYNGTDFITAKKFSATWSPNGKYIGLTSTKEQRSTVRILSIYQPELQSLINNLTIQQTLLLVAWKKKGYNLNKLDLEYHPYLNSIYQSLDPKLQKIL